MLSCLAAPPSLALPVLHAPGCSVYPRLLHTTQRRPLLAPAILLSPGYSAQPNYPALIGLSRLAAAILPNPGYPA